MSLTVLVDTAWKALRRNANRSVLTSMAAGNFLTEQDVMKATKAAVAVLWALQHE